MSMDIVVVNYKSSRDLRQFMNSYEFFAPSQPHAVHIMNVAPDEQDMAAAEYFRQRNHNVQVTAFGENVGYGHAVNVGVAQGSYDTVAIFNADIVLTTGALDICADYLWSREHIGVVGPRQHDEKGRVTHAGIFGTNDKPEHRGWQSTNSLKFRDAVPAVTVSGSAYFIRRHVWDFLTACENYQEFASEPAGAFLETQHYFEETWCSYHAREHGYSVMYYGLVDIIHKWHRASPVGGTTDRIVMPQSRQMFRECCDHHGIAHD